MEPQTKFVITWKMVLRELKEAALIFLLGGLFQQVVLEGMQFEDLEEMVKQWAISGMFWVFLWKGNAYVVSILDLTGPTWLEKPLKRFVLSFAASISYTLVASFLIYYIAYTVVYNVEYDRFIDALGPFSFFVPVAITLAIGGILHGRGFLFEWRQSAIDNERLKTEQVSTQYESLKNQVNPHFLFNSLNALSSLVYDDQKKAVEFIRKLSDVYRYVLDQRDKEVVPLKEELDFVNSFIFLQQIRFDKNLVFANSLPKLSGAMVPPLSLQTLIENAIKHNIISQDKPLTIEMREEEDFIVVRNNLQSKKSESTGVGLQNLRARYQYLSDRPVVVDSDADSFTVKVPILKLS